MQLPQFAPILGRPKKLRRVCMLNPQGYVEYPAPLGQTDTGGQTLYVLELARALGKKGIKVDIVTRKFGDKKDEEQVFENVKIVRIPCGPSEFIVKEELYELMPEMVEHIEKYLQRNRKKYDLIHSHYWDGGYAGILLSKALHVPHVHTPHSLGKVKETEMVSADTPPPRLRPILRYHMRIAVEQKIMGSADAILVICETSRIQILEHYVVDFEKVHVIYPGIDTKVFGPKATAIDKEVNLKKNAILTVSRFSPTKGIDRTIEAVNLINDVPFHVYLAGGGNMTDMSQEELDTQAKLSELVKKLGMEDKVTFLHELDHNIYLPAYYRAASVYVSAARYDPFGLTTMEAMACGTVPVISSVAGSREVIIDALNGFIVDAHDRQKLADTIAHILKHKSTREKISENAVITIQNHYQWEKIVEKILVLYQTIL